MKLSDRLLSLSPSATFAMSAKSAELKAQGIDVINMSVGEPDFDTPESIKAAAKEAIDRNITRYSPVPGYADLRKAICGKLKGENGLSFNPSQIIVSNGAKQSITNTVLALVNPGDEVIIPAPFWVSYPQMVKLAGGVPVHVTAGIDNDFKITPAQLEAAITPRTRLLILCSPCNPTGSVYSRAELEALAVVLLAHEQVLVISDEIYEHLNYIGGHASIAAVPGMKERTVVVNGVSKAYAMTGWRIGFIAAPEWIAKGCSLLQGQYTSGPCSVSQMAALEAWEGDQGCVEAMRQAFERRRDLIVKLAREIPGLEVNVPQGAFYLFPKCSGFFGKTVCPQTAGADDAGAAGAASGWAGRVIENSTDFAMFLLEDAHVATVGGDAFGSPDCFRMSFALSDELIVEAMHRIKASLTKLS